MFQLSLALNQKTSTTILMIILINNKMQVDQVSNSSDTLEPDKLNNTDEMHPDKVIDMNITVCDELNDNNDDFMNKPYGGKAPCNIILMKQRNKRGMMMRMRQELKQKEVLQKTPIKPFYILRHKQMTKMQMMMKVKIKVKQDKTMKMKMTIKNKNHQRVDLVCTNTSLWKILIQSGNERFKKKNRKLRMPGMNKRRK